VPQVGTVVIDVGTVALHRWAMGKSTEMRYVPKLHRERNGVTRPGELRGLDRVGWRKIALGRSTVESQISISRKR